MISKIKDKSIDEIYCKIKDKLIKNFLKIYEYYGFSSITTKNNEKIINLIDINELELNELIDNDIKYIVDKYINHEFDLLGSGWVKINYNINPKGLDGVKYDPVYRFDRLSEEYLSILFRKKHYKRAIGYYKLISKDYNHIDWQVDFKSGYRYSEKIWYKNQPIAPKIGVDIKVPWELARLQHLLQMAIYSIKVKDKREVILKEFRNQVIDFIMMNPVNMGVNWACTMEVAIRSINLLLSFDIFKQIDTYNILDNEFYNIFIIFINQHRTFIENNLEWNNKVCNNHYLSNLVGLLFIEAYLGEYSENNEKYNFTVKQLLCELDKQFNEDGSNFEASTAYHVLSGELMVLSMAIISRFNLIKCKFNNDKRFKNSSFRLIEKNTNKFNAVLKYTNIQEKLLLSSKFVEDITFGNKIIQIGDNDSGKIIKLTPNLYYEDEIFREDILNKSYYIDLVNGLNKKAFKQKKYALEYSFMKSLCKNDNTIEAQNIYENIKPEVQYMKTIACEEELIYECRKRFNFNDYGLEKIELNNLQQINYNDFGLAIIRNQDIFISVMYGGIGQNGNGGHAHNDKLSVELIIGKEHILSDKGSYLYTASSSRRDQYRSVYSHNVPIVNSEEQDELNGLFSMKKRCECQLIEFTDKKIKVIYTRDKVIITRAIIIYDESIEIIDKSNFRIVQNFNFNLKFSRGYGIINK